MNAAVAGKSGNPEHAGSCGLAIPRLPIVRGGQGSPLVVPPKRPILFLRRHYLSFLRDHAAFSCRLGVFPARHNSNMSARDQIMAIDEDLADLHTLIILLQSRDTTKYPLPANADELLDRCEEQLNRARDSLKALAVVDDQN